MSSKLLIITTIALAAVFVFSEVQGQTSKAFPLDIVWKADTYVPAGFGVKARPVSGSIITLTALTPTRDPDSLEFVWIIEDSSYLGQGPAKIGRGENTFDLFTNPIISRFTHKVKVIAQTVAGGQETTARVRIPLAEPEVGLYIREGQYARSAGDQFVGTPGRTAPIYAKPFYFSAASIFDLAFSWVFDGEKVPVGAEPDVLRLSISADSQTGIERRLKLNVENRQNEREEAQASSNLLIIPPR